MFLPHIGAGQAFAQTWTEWNQYIPGGMRTGTLQDLIRSIINLALLLAGVVAVIYIIIGGYQYITAGGNPEQAQAAKTTIMNAVIGLVIVFASYVIVNFIFEQVIHRINSGGGTGGTTGGGTTGGGTTGGGTGTGGATGGGSPTGGSSGGSSTVTPPGGGIEI